MNAQAIYLDNQSTTRVDPRVLDRMLPWFTEHYGNAASITHAFGNEAREAVETARGEIAAAINAQPREIIFTSGATESNNLAIYGIAKHAWQKGNHVVSVVTEHKAVLDPLLKLQKNGFDVTLLPVRQVAEKDCGLIDLDQLRDSLNERTCLVTVMMANNEIGTIQPLREIAKICSEKEIPFHSDAAQGIGKIEIDVRESNVDLMSLTAHKIYGPKGIGALFIRRGSPRLRVASQIDGGGHEHGLRSGTLNVPAIIGFAEALKLCLQDLPAEQERLLSQRNRLFEQLSQQLPGVYLNGPELSDPTLRLPGNLNCRFDLVDGEALAMNLDGIAVSTGSACTSADPLPSHVLQAIGLTEDQARSSIRFGLGRFNDSQQIDVTISAVAQAITRLRKLSSMS